MKNLILLITLFVSACSDKDGASANGLAAETITNVAYGTDQRQKLDIYLPANRNANDTKLLVLIHGGGWTEGDKADFNQYIAELKKRMPELAIANINYRLVTGSQNFFPTQENDVKAAIEFLAGKSAEYKISNQIALLGASAGAHLALLHSYKYSSPVQVKAVVSFFGPTELVALYNSAGNAGIPFLLNAVLGGTPATKATLYQQSSPYNFVSPQSAPTLLLHGGNDPLVPASQTVLLKDKLTANNVVNQYVFYPSEGHGWVGQNLVDSFEKIEAFLEQHLL
jgi:acetyl esterase/lipase